MSATAGANPPEAGRQEPAASRLAMSVEEASRALGISTWLGYELVAKGVIPSIRLGRRIIVPRAALERWLAGGSPALDQGAS